MSDIQNYFEYIIKKYKISISSIRIYVTKTETRITFKIKIEHCLELSRPEIMNLLGRTEYKITKYKRTKICFYQNLWK